MNQPEVSQQIHITFGDGKKMSLTREEAMSLFQGLKRELNIQDVAPIVVQPVYPSYPIPSLPVYSEPSPAFDPPYRIGDFPPFSPLTTCSPNIC
jgi:hypothetical protein